MRIVTRRGACGIRRAAVAVKRIVIRIARELLADFCAPFQCLHHLNCHFDSRAGSGLEISTSSFKGTWSFPPDLKSRGWLGGTRFQGTRLMASLRIICPQFSHGTLLKDTYKGTPRVTYPILSDKSRIVRSDFEPRFICASPFEDFYRHPLSTTTCDIFTARRKAATFLASALSRSIAF